MKKIFALSAVIIFCLQSSALFSQVNWFQQNSSTAANLWAIQFLDANNGYACGDAGTVVKTTDGGLVWTAVNINTTNPVRDIFFVNANEGWAAVGDENNSTASGEIWHTTDGGLSWTQQTPSTTEARFGVSMASSAAGWVVGSRNGPINIDATVNGGGAWTNQSDNNIFGWLYKIDALSTSTAFAIGGAFFPAVTGFIIKTVNGGSTWTQNNTGTIPFLSGLDMADANTGFAAGDAGTILATTNGGAAWTAQTSGTSDTLQDISFVSASTGWTCGYNGTIRRTTDGGTNWTGETSGIAEALNGIFALDTTTVWAAGGSGIIIRRALGIGINEGNNISADAIIVHPNPARTEMNFDLSPFNGSGESCSLKIYDLFGKELFKTENITERNFIFNAALLSEGLYFYVVRKGSKNLFAGKIAVQ